MGFTPLQLAVASGQIECLKLLMDKGANHLVVDFLGNTIVHIAANLGNNKMLEFCQYKKSIDILENLAVARIRIFETRRKREDSRSVRAHHPVLQRPQNFGGLGINLKVLISYDPNWNPMVELTFKPTI